MTETSANQNGARPPTAPVDPFAAHAYFDDFPRIIHIGLGEKRQTVRVTVTLSARHVEAIVQHFGRLVADGETAPEVTEMHGCFVGVLGAFSDDKVTP